MKCVFVRDVDVDVTTLDEGQKSKLKFRKVRVGQNTKLVAYFPSGTEYEHANAPFFVRQGMADPADDECAEAADLSAEQRTQLQHKYRRLAAGILREDFELFDSGVIVGYEQDGSYKHGPNWAAYQEAQAAEAFPDPEEI